MSKIQTIPKEEPVLADEEPMTAAWTNQHDEEKHTGIRDRKKRRKQAKQARKSYSRRRWNQSFPSLLQSRVGDLATRSAIFFILSSTAVSSVSTAAVAPPLRQHTNTNQLQGIRRL